MKKIKNLRKICLIDEDTIEIILEDTRDNYIQPLALGKIGTIYISPNGILFYPNIEGLEDDIDILRERYLKREFCEIFEATDYNPLSAKYYHAILALIDDGTLESLGYEIKNANEELENSFNSCYLKTKKLQF